ncbi:DNA methyltransferase [Psychrobacillus sp. MER TA 171]|uniref:DNA methyltransferase n=1 Tax=Psychrobacillus sp. MER TA 171 TaxID=2939577 RepID=UPI00203C943F|nr:DNA methyltransferase [Psychrobacillus sp. MER TA 171]MCM3358661.1 DNA methylase [Psychrobacillus sp. MER TA 171]
MTSNSKQLSLLNEETVADNSPVVCLGMTFENEETRREYFREELRKKLPELKLIEGFPIGEDEDIITLSDPPYYTACPNPWINDFIETWEQEKVTKYGRDLNEEYHREPLAADVSEGKQNPIYNAHSYHTKVPHKAIMRYILHYTSPGDIVLDGFSGTGMTGVAGQMCSNLAEIKELGYQINEKNEIIYEDEVISQAGFRNIILNDLSPAGAFITYNYNYPQIDSESFKEEARKILKDVENEHAWKYSTDHIIDGQTQYDVDGNALKGQILYTVFSDVFICSNCQNEIVFWKAAVDTVKGEINDSFKCPHCAVEVTKRKLDRAWVSYFDSILKKPIEMVKKVPVLIRYEVNNKRYTKEAAEGDFSLINKIDQIPINDWIPSKEINLGDKSIEALRIGLTHTHLYYTKRNLSVLSSLFNKSYSNQLKFILTGMLTRSSKQARFLAKNYFHGGGGWVGTSLSGTLFFPSLNIEVNPLFTYSNRIEKSISYERENRVLVSNQSTGNMSQIDDNSIDYIFTDPPFGANLMYSELNNPIESWLKVETNTDEEAIMNKTQRKKLPEYQTLMEKCFKVYYRVLKPQKWITVEFSNSQASVWNVIQAAMERAGFVIANVAALDKKQGSFNAVTSTTAVKQDLVISAYKPSEENIKKMHENVNSVESAWVFVQQHLEKLPVFIGSKGESGLIAERTPRILFDRMVAYHVQNGLPVPISSAEFQQGVAQRFPMRDGMAFLESQVAEYDKKRTLVKEFSQMSLFVSDENSAIEWIRQQLMRKPQTRQDLHPQFMKEIQHIAKHEQLPELDDLLAQNFLRFEGDESVPDQIAGYLRRNYHDYRGLENNNDKLRDKGINRWYVPDPNKQADLEKLREKALLREFEHYVEELSTHKKKLRQFRTEAVRAGFKKSWGEKNYEKIVTVGDRLPETVIQEDDKLLMYYDNAQVRLDM